MQPHHDLDTRPDSPYERRRAWLTEYFDRTAASAWDQLTSDAPVSGIRRTVRAGRDRMRETLLAWLPERLDGRTVLDAGCGTGVLAIELARRGARVRAVDLSPTLVAIAQDRAAAAGVARAISFDAGDMLAAASEPVDYVVCMDSLIHYPLREMVGVLAQLTELTRRSVVFTFAPRTPLLATLHATGRLFPRRDRAPAIEPVAERALREAVAAHPRLGDWSAERGERVASGFYTSHALEVVRRSAASDRAVAHSFAADSGGASVPSHPFA